MGNLKFFWAQRLVRLTVKFAHISISWVWSVSIIPNKKLHPRRKTTFSSKQFQKIITLYQIFVHAFKKKTNIITWFFKMFAAGSKNWRYFQKCRPCKGKILIKKFSGKLPWRRILFWVTNIEKYVEISMKIFEIISKVRKKWTTR